MSGHPSRTLALAVSAIALTGCNISAAGIPPTKGTLNFPIAVALSPADSSGLSHTLFVANSNFDLRFNHGTLMAFSLDEIAGDEVRTGEEIGGLLEGCTKADPCTFADVSQIELDEVAIGSHADGLAVSPDGRRLYLAARSKQDLGTVDWDGAKFHCGEDRDVEGVPVCADAFQMGATPDGGVAMQRELTLSGDPVDVAAGRLSDVGGPVDGNFVLLALREGRVALYIDQHPGSEQDLPVLTDIIEGIPTSSITPSLVTLTLQPGTGLGWLTNADSRDLGRVGVIVPADPLRASLFNAGALRLGGLDDGQDTRDLQFDPRAPTMRAWVLARRPESVVTLDLSRMGLNANDVGLGQIYEVGAGPSRIAVALIGGRTYVLATCFDAKKIFVIDADQGALVAVVGGISGPFELAVDEARQLAYVTDFSLSVVRIVDLEPLTRAEDPFVRATLGEPTPIPTFAR